MDKKQPRRAYPADPQLREKLQQLIDARGFQAAADELPMTPSTLARLVAGGTVLDGTVELARARLLELEAEIRGRVAPAGGSHVPEHVAPVVARILRRLEPSLRRNLEEGS